jgi:hypothetical protein
MNNSAIPAPEMTAAVLHIRAPEQSCFQLSGARRRIDRVLFIVSAIRQKNAGQKYEE